MFEQLLQGPESEPLSVAQLAIFSHFDAPDETDDELEYNEVLGQIGAAREQIERQTQFCFLSQRWRQTLDAFPKIYIGRDQNWHWNVPATWPYRADVIELLRHPVQTVESVKYLDQDGAEQILEDDTYDLKNDRIILKVGQAWPFAARVPDSVSVEYTTGYDPDGSPPVPIPYRLIRALKFLAGWYYDNRIPVSQNPTTQVQLTLSNLLTGFRSNYMAR